ncbi:phage major tail protein, TP901-1 family [Algimonas ampicilliniresistens]|jgi:TP901-1 family phage major tail protein|uniref:Phage major tail protein, TP901-1 family n=1 Tax=Algimonas ampicilliniresistens TaxID=1298735 RepID=A0ABQ5V6Q9_9PROT|nr:phage major tail protein, TP901-1 family [Algimonas ampicilliniresistens]GLQ22767.1 phage major tail protein, TP901-1 family [Algimonas ampicilliniresistens]
MTATHTPQRGRDMLLKIEDGGAYSTVAGLRTKSIRMNSQTVDVTDQASNGWTELLPEAGIRSVSVTGSGVFRDADSDARVRSAFFAQEAVNAQMIVPEFGTITASMLVTGLTYGGTFKGEASFELTLVSAGEPSFIPA